MTTTGSLPPASIHGTWSDNVEIWDVDSDELADLTDVTEITLLLRDHRTGFNELTLTMSNGDIIIPSTGIVQWRAEVGSMGALDSKMYDVILLFENADDTVPIILGTVSVTG